MARPPVLLALLALLLAAAGCRSAPPSLEALTEGRFALIFEGNRAYDEARLLQEIALEVREFEERGSFKATVDDAAYAIQRFYRQEGWPDALVDYAIEEREGGAAAVLAIREGLRKRIGAVRIEGNTAFDDELLGSFFRPASAGLFSRPQAWFVRREVANAAERIAAYYAANGWLDVRVSEPEALETDDPQVLDLQLRVDEGVRHHLREVRFEGGVEEVNAAVDLEEFLDEPYSRRVDRNLLGRVVETYGRRGWPEVEVEIAEVDRRAGGGVGLVYAIREGPRVRITDVRVEGAEKTRREFILSNLEIRPGERYDVRKERKSFRNLYRTGIFSSVRILLEPPADEEERTLVVRVEEATSTELYVEPGYGSYEGLRLGLGWRERNLFGTGRILSVEANLAQLAQRGEIGVTSPRFLGSDWIASTSVFANRREEPSFLLEEIGGNVNFSRDLSERWRLTTGYEYRRSDVDAEDITDPDVQNALGIIDVSSVSLAGIYDSRDSRFLPPTRGTRARGGVELASSVIGSEVEFVRLTYAQAWFQELSRDTVLAFSWRTGLIVPIQDTDVIPIQERFFNGGENTVRAFEEDELGPEDAQGNPIGGETLNVWNLELRQRLRGFLHGALFADAGNVAPDHSDYLDYEDVRYGLGVGLRYVLPIGPIRLDLGWNPETRGGEDPLELHLSVGMAF